MATVSERVHVMMENFMALHDQGYSIPEIAKQHNLSFPSVYNHLQEIADANGVTRDSLLQIVRTEKSERALAEEKRRINIDVNAMLTEFGSASESIKEIIKKIDEVEKKETEV